MNPNANTRLIEALGLHLTARLRNLDLGRRCALLDFPHHNNVGDNAIWAGERIALQRAGFDVAYTCDLSSYREADIRKALRPGEPVFLHGGGNLGSVWPAHQAFREHILSSLRDHPVIQLPQSAHFDDVATLERYGTQVARHGAATVWVRDVESQSTLRTVGVASEVVPDAAFALGPISRPKPARVDVLVLARSDHESVQGRWATASGVLVCDWLVGEPGRPWMSQVHRGTVRARGLYLKAMARSDFAARLSTPVRLATFDALASMRIARGLRTLAHGRTVITDRLHAHILSLLLGIPHVVLDNHYGKIARFRAAFTSSASDVYVAPREHALSLARELAVQSKPARAHESHAPSQE